MRLPSLKPSVGLVDLTAVRAGGDTSSWRFGRTSSAARGYSYRWQQAREAYLRAHPLCCFCESKGKVRAATVVDHREPHRGDERLFWARDNWQGLCASCHSGEKQRQESASLR